MADFQQQPMSDLIAKALMGLKLDASNQGQLQDAPQMFNPVEGFAQAPVYGGSYQFPGSGLSLQGQYQQIPGARPNYGVTAKYGIQF